MLSRALVITFLVAALSLPATAKPRKRIRPIVYRKPPSVVVQPDVVEAISYGEYWRRVELAWWLGRSWWVL